MHAHTLLHYGLGAGSYTLQIHSHYTEQIGRIYKYYGW